MQKNPPNRTYKTQITDSVYPLAFTILRFVAESYMSVCLKVQQKSAHQKNHSGNMSGTVKQEIKPNVMFNALESLRHLNRTPQQTRTVALDNCRSEATARNSSLMYSFLIFTQSKTQSGILLQPSLELTMGHMDKSHYILII